MMQSLSIDGKPRWLSHNHLEQQLIMEPCLWTMSYKIFYSTFSTISNNKRRMLWRVRNSNNDAPLNKDQLPIPRVGNEK